MLAVPQVLWEWRETATGQDREPSPSRCTHGTSEGRQPESPDLNQYLDLNYVFYSKPNAAFLVKPAIPKAFLPGPRCL